MQSEMIDLMENKIIGPAIRQGIGRMVHRLLERRFGPVPDWALEKLNSASPDELEEWGLRVESAETLEKVFL